jgi:tRNA(adenine34) deaminase
VTDQDFMRRALLEADTAASHDDVPIGAVLVKDGQVLAACGNQRWLRQDPTAHAELLALRSAAQRLGTWHLEGTTMYVTLEPCPMCAGALVLARVKRLVYGPQDPKAGAALSLYNIVQDPRLNHELEITPGVLQEECAAVLQTFFQSRRTGPAL